MNADTGTALRSTWATPTAPQLQAFFGDADNFHSGIRVASIIYAVGRHDIDDDWDRGQWMYEWRRPGLRVRVCTYCDYVSRIEQLDPASTGRFDVAVALLWERPAHDNGG